jgi:SAM-dependent methyltransferase
LIEAVHPHPDDTVLDVACGTGALTMPLARLTRHVTGIDLTAAMLDQARILQKKLGLKNVELLQGDAFPLPFSAASFSLVVSRAAFHHLVNPGDVLAEMARVCTPAGRIVVIDGAPSEQHSEAFDHFEILRDPSHVHALSPNELRGLGKKIGLRETAVLSTTLPGVPLETILAASFPNPGDMEKVRGLARADAESGANRLGMDATLEDGQIVMRFPLTMVVWQR